MHPRIHRLIRFSALFVTAVSLGYAAQRSNLRADVTEEGLSQITKPTQELASLNGMLERMIINLANEEDLAMLRAMEEHSAPPGILFNGHNCPNDPHARHRRACPAPKPDKP